MKELGRLVSSEAALHPWLVHGHLPLCRLVVFLACMSVSYSPLLVRTPVTP